MSRLLLFLFFISTLLSCESINDKDKRNADWIWWVDAKTGKGVWIPVGNRKPEGKTGAYTAFYFNGKISQKGKLANGKHIDTIFCYDITGKPEEYMIPYKNDSPQDGYQDSIEYFYRNGPIKMLKVDGSVSAVGIVENHNYGDKWIAYSQNRKPSYIRNLNHGTGWITRYYDDGNVKDSIYSDNGHTFQLRIFYDDGKLNMSAEFKNHDYNGFQKEYYANGHMKAIDFLVNGKSNGRSMTWFENGNLKAINYKKDDIFDGPDSVYYENGKLGGIIYMKNGKLDGEAREFGKDGKLLVDRIYKGGVVTEDKLVEQTLIHQNPQKSK